MATAGSISIKTGFTIDTASYNRVNTQINRISKNTSAISDGFKKVGSVAKSLGVAVAAAFSIKAITNFTNECKKLYEVQMTAETKLETVLRQRMGLRSQEIQQVKDYASTLQGLGVVGDEVQLSGAAQLATFLNQQKALTVLMPALNNLLAAQKGLNGTAQDAYNIGNMLGKVMQGQTSALRRVGITFSEAEENVLKYGDELERATMLSQIITQNVGEMNAALANTPLGRQQQLKNTIGDIKERFGEAAVNIGTLFLPVLQKVAVWLDAIASVAIKVSSALAQVFGGSKLKQSATPISSISTETDDAVSGLEDLGDAYESAGSAASKASRGVLGFDSVIQIGKDTGSGSGSTGSSGGASVGVDSITPSLETEEVDGQIESLAERIQGALENVKNYLSERIEMPNLAFDTEKIQNETLEILHNIGATFASAGTFIINIAFKFWNDIDGVGLIEDTISLITRISETVRSAVDAITPALTTFYEIGIAPIVQWIGEKLRDALSFLGEQISKVGVWFEENREKIDEFAQTLGEIVSIIWSFIEPIANVAWEAFKTVLGLIVDALMLLATWLLENHKWILLIVAAVAEIWIIMQIPAILGAIGAAISTIIGVVQGAITVITTIFGIIAANPLMLIPLAIAAIVTAIIYLWNTNEDFRNFILGVFDAIKSAFGAVWDFIKLAASAGLEVLKGVVDFLVNGFQNGFESSLGFIGTLIDGWVNGIKEHIEGVKMIFGGIIDFITGVFTGDWDKAFGGLKNIVLGVFKALGSIVMGPFQTIANVWNAIVDKIGNLTVPEWVPGIGGKGFSLPRINLPKLAAGGVITTKTWAEIGEQGPEVVMPLRNTSFTAAFAEDLVKAQVKYNGNQNSGVVIQIMADKVIGNDWTQIAREVKKALEKENVRVGGVSYAY